MIRKPEVGCDAFFRLPSCKTIFRFCVPRYPDKLEFFFMIPDTSLHQHNDVGIFDLDNLFCFQPNLFC